MCGTCKDLDDYESKHGHKCEDDCISYCETCDKKLCVYANDEYKVVDKIKLCMDCMVKEFGYDDMGTYYSGA